MKLIDNLRQRVTEFNELLQSGRLIQSIILENEYVITDMNSEDQLYEQGINRLGVNIMDYAPYSPLTIEIKKEKADTQQFTIKAADWKTEDLIQRYGRQILGLTEENKIILIWAYIYPELKAKTKEYIYGK